MAESSHLACAHASFEKSSFWNILYIEIIWEVEFKKQTFKLLDTKFLAFMQPDQPEKTWACFRFNQSLT